MGKIEKGILGAISGLVGTVVGARWRNVDVLRSRPRKSRKPKTENQLEIQSRFKLVSDFLNKISSYIKLGYQSSISGPTATNTALSYHLKNAVLGTYPDFTLDYSKVKLSNENSQKILPLPEATTTLLPLNKIKVEWSNPTGVVDESDDLDVLHALVYSPEKDMFISPGFLPTRIEQTFTITVPRMLNTSVVHMWAFFASADGKRVSRTSYLGQFTTTN